MVFGSLIQLNTGQLVGLVQLLPDSQVNITTHGLTHLHLVGWRKHDIVEAHCYVVDNYQIDLERLEFQSIATDCRTFQLVNTYKRGYEMPCSHLLLIESATHIYICSKSIRPLLHMWCTNDRLSERPAMQTYKGYQENGSVV